MIAQVAERIGGVDRMVEWVQEDPENERVFWTSIYPKLLAVQRDQQNPVQGNITFTWMPPTDDTGPPALSKQTIKQIAGVLR